MGNNREGEAAVVESKRGTSEVFETKTVAHQETKRTRGVAMALCRRMSASMPLFEPLFQPAAMHQLLFQQPTGLSSGRPTAAMQVVEHEHRMVSYRLSSRRNRKMSRYPNVVKFPSRGKR